MNGQSIADKITNLTGDTMDTDFIIQLINDEKNSIETELQLEITKKLNTANTTTPGQTSSTAITLPTDFFLPLTIYTGTTPFSPVPFEQQQFFKDTPQRYWINVGSSAYHLCGTQSSAQTIYFFYQYATPDLASDTLTSWSPVWPSRFHSLIPYAVARKYFAIDQGEKSRSWMPEHEIFYKEIKRQMIDWDAKLKLNALDNSTFLDTAPYPSENRINF
jgi:hypothetical protein